MSDPIQFSGRELTPKQRQELVSQVVGGWEGFARTTGSIFFDRPNFIAGAGPDNPLANVIRTLTRYNCRVWARQDKSQLSPAVNTGNAALCTPYLDSISELPEEGTVGPKFPGGQCNVLYIISARGDQCPTEVNDATSQVSGIGPIQLIGTIRDPAPGNPGFTRTRWTFRFSDNQERTLTTLSLGDSGATACFRVFPTSGDDDCGNPPPAAVDPSTPTGLPALSSNVIINVPGYGELTATVTPRDDGGITLCIEELEICIELDPPFGGGGGGGQLSPGDQGEAGETEESGDGGEVEGEAPDGKVLVGLRLDLVAAPPSANELRVGLYRGAAYIYMGGDEGLDQDFAGSILRSGQFVFAEKDNLNRWRVISNPGYNWAVTPFYRESES